jgi:hypothetical protein
MQKSVKAILSAVVAVNTILILFFVFVNYTIWYYVESSADLVKLVSFSPFRVAVSFLGEWVNGQIMPVSALPSAPMFNFPFWLFFVSTSINLCFMALLLRQKETTKQA